MSRILALILFVILGTPALATTINFNNLAPYAGGGCGIAPPTYSESGYTVSGCPTPFATPGTVHLHSGGGQFSGYLTLTYDTGQPFTVKSLDVYSGSSLIYDSTRTYFAYDNLLFTGYVGATQVASQVFSTGVNGGSFTVMLNNMFQNLTSFTVTLIDPTPAMLASFGTGAVCANPCSHVDIDNIVVSAVPLPASAALLGAGLLGLFGIGRARRHS